MPTFGQSPNHVVEVPDTGGQVRRPTSGAALTVRDLSGQPVTGLTVGPYGYVTGSTPAGVHVVQVSADGGSSWRTLVSVEAETVVAPAWAPSVTSPHVAAALARIAVCMWSGEAVPVTVVGDSIAGGVSWGGGGADTAWPYRLVSSLGTLRGRWGNPNQYVAGDAISYVYGSGVAGPDFQGHVTLDSGEQVTVSCSTPSTTIKVRYLNSGGFFGTAGTVQVTVDGGAPVTLTPTGAGTQGEWTTTVASGTHSVVVTNTGGAGTIQQLSGIYFGTASGGVVLNNAAIPGTRTDDWMASHWISQWSNTGRESGGLAFLSLGTNDASGDPAPLTPLATYRTNLAALADRIITDLTKALVVVIAPPASATPAARWAQYVAAARAVAAERSLPVVDMTARWGTWAAADAAGLMADVTHPGALGYLEMARAIARGIGA